MTKYKQLKFTFFFIILFTVISVIPSYQNKPGVQNQVINLAAEDSFEENDDQANAASISSGQTYSIQVNDTDVFIIRLEPLNSEFLIFVKITSHTSDGDKTDLIIAILDNGYAERAQGTGLTESGDNNINTENALSTNCYIRFTQTSANHSVTFEVTASAHSAIPPWMIAMMIGGPAVLVVVIIVIKKKKKGKEVDSSGTLSLDDY